MPKVVAVKFPFATHTLWFSPEGLDVAPEEITAGTEVICKTARGEEFGLVEDAPFEVDEKRLKDTIGDAKLSNIVRLATGVDSAKHDELVEKAFSFLPKFRELAVVEKLPIKPMGIEFTVDGKTAICYFASEERVDFRQLVKNLAHALDAKVDMRQIGVREEAGQMGGFAQCGQELCCARWETKFAPISIRMAKEQDLPLNSPKISGVCGRLMCCLRYEVEAYKDFKKRAPKINAKISTPLGEAKVTSLNTLKETVTLSLEDDKTLDVPLKFLTCLTKEGKEAASRPNTLTQEDFEKLEEYEAAQALAAGNGFAEITFSSAVSRVSEGLAEEDRLDVSASEKSKKKNKKRGKKVSGAQGGEKASGEKRSKRNRRRGKRAAAKSEAPAGTKRRRRPGDRGQGAFVVPSASAPSAGAPTTGVSGSSPADQASRVGSVNSSQPASTDTQAASSDFSSPSRNQVRRRRHHSS